MLAAVQTTGVNPEALAATLGPLLATLGALGKWIAGRQDRHHAENTGALGRLQERVDSIDEHGSRPMRDLAQRLTSIEGHLERQDTANRGIAERVARLEGPVTRTEAALEGARGGGEQQQ